MCSVTEHGYNRFMWEKKCEFWFWIRFDLCTGDSIVYYDVRREDGRERRKWKANVREENIWRTSLPSSIYVLPAFSERKKAKDTSALKSILMIDSEKKWMQIQFHKDATLPRDSHWSKESLIDNFMFFSFEFDGTTVVGNPYCLERVDSHKSCIPAQEKKEKMWNWRMSFCSWKGLYHSLLTIPQCQLICGEQRSPT